MEENTNYDEKLSEILSLLTKLDKKVDKLNNITAKIGKALHLIPVSLAEERSIQLAQRTNLSQAAQVSAELDAMQPPKQDNTPEMISIFDEYSQNELFSSVLGDDYLGG